MLPENFFVVIPAALYNFVRLTIFFVFDYHILTSDLSGSVLSYTNPFSGVDYLYDIPAVGEYGGGLFGDLIFSILEFFEIAPDLTFWNLLCGPVLLVVLAYAFVKFLIPIN